MSEMQGDQSLLNLLQHGDDDAARQLFDRYVSRLVVLARKRISERLSSRVDAEDVVQSVFRTFFVRAKAGKFEVDQQDDLLKLLMRITVHKVLRQVEYHKAAKRDPNVEIAQGEHAKERLADILDREPTPDAANIFLDELENFLNQLRPIERQILELRMQGYSSEEIANELGTYDRKVRRVMERIRGLANQEGIGNVSD